MKKIIFAIIILLIPISIKANYSLDNYRIDMKILDNGDINVTEAFSMSGLYNGYEKIVNYKGNYDNYYGSKIVSIDDINLYNFDDIILNEIRSIDFFNEDVLLNSNLFDRVSKANKGEYGVYTVTKSENNYTYKIYNPSKINKDFYIDYTIKNGVIIHEDIAELSIFNKIGDAVENLEIYIHIPTNNELLKSWVHVEGEYENEIIDNKKVKITVNNLDKSEFDIRLVFDKDSIIDTNKKSNVTVLDKIIELESKFHLEEDNEYKTIKEEVYNLVLKVEQTYDKDAYDAALTAVRQLNDEDLKTELLVKLINLESKVERKYIITKVIYTSIMGIILVGLLIIFYQIYKKNNKKNVLKDKYCEKIPNYYLPATVGYLMKRRISINDLSASILILINNKNIIFEQTKNKKDYKFIKVDVDDLPDSLEKLIKLLFNNENEVTISKIKKRAKTEYNVFLNQYSNWINSSIDEAMIENFYEDILFIKIFGICYSIIGIVISALFLDKSTYFSPIVTIIVCILSMLYFILFYKRTTKGKEQYYKWNGLRKFMINFNNISEDKLPKIDLWDEYFIYSISLGCNDKLSKNMKLQIDKKTDNVSDIVSFQFLVNFYKIIDDAIKKSISIAYKEKGK